MANVELVKAIKVGNVVTSLGELAAGDSITLKGDGASTAGAIAINNATNANSTTITSGNVSANITFTLPDAVGSVGQVLKVSTVPDANSNVLTWGADTEGIAYTDLSVSTSAASGSGSLAYNNTDGTFTFAPADLTTITSTSNGDISLLPDGTGQVLIDGDGTTGNGGVSIENGVIDLKNSGTVSNLKLYCEVGNAHYTELVSSPHANYSGIGNVTLTLPTTSGTVSTQSYATGKAVAFSIVFGG